MPGNRKTDFITITEKNVEDEIEISVTRNSGFFSVIAINASESVNEEI